MDIGKEISDKISEGKIKSETNLVFDVYITKEFEAEASAGVFVKKAGDFNFSEFREHLRRNFGGGTYRIEVNNYDTKSFVLKGRSFRLYSINEEKKEGRSQVEELLKEQLEYTRQIQLDDRKNYQAFIKELSEKEKKGVDPFLEAVEKLSMLGKKASSVKRGQALIYGEDEQPDYYQEAPQGRFGKITDILLGLGESFLGRFSASSEEPLIRQSGINENYVTIDQLNQFGNNIFKQIKDLLSSEKETKTEKEIEIEKVETVLETENIKAEEKEEMKEDSSNFLEVKAIIKEKEKLFEGLKGILKKGKIALKFSGFMKALEQNKPEQAKAILQELFDLNEWEFKKIFSLSKEDLQKLLLEYPMISKMKEEHLKAVKEAFFILKEVYDEN